MLMNYPGQSLGICTHIITGIHSRLLSQALKNLSKEHLVVNESWNKKATKLDCEFLRSGKCFPHLCIFALVQCSTQDWDAISMLHWIVYDGQVYILRFFLKGNILWEYTIKKFIMQTSLNLVETEKRKHFK